MTTENDNPAPATKLVCGRRIKATVDPAPPPRVAKSASKSDTVIKLLLRAKGATPTELIAATDWQPHSLRAFLSGLRKKGRTIVRETRKNGDGTYRIVEAEPAATVVAAAAMAEGAPSGGAVIASDPATTNGADA